MERYLTWTALLLLFQSAHGLRRCSPPNKIRDSSYETKGIELPNGDFNPGATVKYKCNEGYTKGMDSIEDGVCENGYWKGIKNFRCCKIQICIDPALHCKLPEVNNAAVDIVGGIESFPMPYDKIGYGTGTTILYSCDDKYVLRNGSTRGPYECIGGSKWSPANLTKCDRIECPPPPNIRNGSYRKFSLDGYSDKYYVGTIVEYKCNSGYENSMLKLKHAACNTDLKWVPSYGFAMSSWGGYLIDMFPECRKSRTTDYISSYGNGGTSYGSGSGSSSSGGSGGNSDLNTNYSYKSKKKEWSGLKTVFVVVTIFIAMGVCLCACASNSGSASRGRAIVLDGVTATQYSGATTVYTGPPVYIPNVPEATTYTPNYGQSPVPTAPPEAIPLTPHYGCKPNDDPPNYEEAMRNH